MMNRQSPKRLIVLVVIMALLSVVLIVKQRLVPGAPTTPAGPASSGVGDRSRSTPSPEDADPNRRVRDWPVLIDASYRGDIELVKGLLAQGADVNRAGPESWTALMQAAGHGHTDIVVLLLESGAKVNAENQVGRTAYDLADARGHAEAAELLRQHGAITEQFRQAVGAVCRYDARDLQRLIDAGLDVNLTDGRGRSILYYALHEDSSDHYQKYYDYFDYEFQPDAIILLLESGADPNLTDELGQTPLFSGAGRLGSRLEQIWPAFEAAGVRLDLIDIYGRTMLHQNTSPLLMQRIVDAGVSINSQDMEGDTPLHLHIRNSNASAIDFLCSQGADLSISNDAGQIPLTLFGEKPESNYSLRRWTRVYEVLLKHGLVE